MADHWSKCDEKRPACIKCRIRGLECKFPDIVARDASKALQRARHPKGKALPHKDTLATANRQKERPLSPAAVSDFDLAQHYLGHTMHMLASTSRRKEVADIWQIVLPALAFTDTTVHHGMLTIAAMCLHFHESNMVDPCSKFLLTAEAHGEMFVGESSRQLREMHPSKIESNFVCSKLLCVLGFAFYRNHRSKGTLLTDDAAWRWLHLLRGVLPTYEAMVESNHDINSAIMRDMIPEISSPDAALQSYQLGEALDRSQPLFSFIKQSQRQQLSALHLIVNKMKLALGAQQYNDLITAIATLQHVTEHVCDGDVHSLYRAICTFPGSVSKGFVEMLTSTFPLALAIYAHWLVLVILIEDLWWVGDMGRAGIREIVDLCALDGVEFMSILEWPRQALQFEDLHSNSSVRYARVGLTT